VRLGALVLCAASLLAGPVRADQRIYSYVPADEATRKRIDSGLTFVFDRGVMGMRVKEILATEANAQAAVDPASERELGARLGDVLPAGAGERELYLIKAVDQGPAMVRAFCPGSTKGWLVFGPLRARESVRIHALGDDPAGGARHCATLTFAFRGEWRLPPPTPFSHPGMAQAFGD
jgi:hypothetical protein